MTSSLIAIALLMSQRPVEAIGSDDSLHYSMGGTMSPPIDLSVSFASGRYSLRETILLPGGKKKELQSHGQLNPLQIAKLRGVALATMNKGFETRECKRSIAKGDLSLAMPNMDADVRMEVSVAGRHATAPMNVGCWTKAANDLVSAALESVHSFYAAAP